MSAAPTPASLRSFIPVAADSHFPIQNLPYGIFSTPSQPARRVGVAIGDQILDLAELAQAGLLPVAGGGEVFRQPSLNALIALGRPAWRALRAALTALLSADHPRLRDDAALRATCLVPAATAQLHLPIRVAGYTDFYSSREHATHVGTMFRDKDNPLLPNWLHIPIGYNGRASTVVVSGTPVRRPLGQLKPPDQPAPVLGPCAKLDYELEIGVVVGRDTPIGDRLSIDEAEDAIFGYTLLNDWSARDIQQWEYVPLGPFQAKAFATSISPWVVTADALAPFRVAGPVQDPAPLPYLAQRGPHNLDIDLEIAIRPAGAAAATTVARTNFKYMYWSSAQQLAHHALCGCAMQVGDLLGSGTISGPTPDSLGSLLELTWNGTRPIDLGGGRALRFLEDGDLVTMRGACRGPGYLVGFGEVSGEILPAA